MLHIRWLLDYRAAEPVLDVQRRGIPEIYQVAKTPVVGDLFAQLRAESAALDVAMAASHELLSD